MRPMNRKSPLLWLPLALLGCGDWGGLGTETEPLDGWPALQDGTLRGDNGEDPWAERDMSSWPPGDILPQRDIPPPPDGDASEQRDISPPPDGDASEQRDISPPPDGDASDRGDSPLEPEADGPPAPGADGEPPGDLKQDAPQDGPPEDATWPDIPPLPRFLSCHQAPYPPADEPQEWNHGLSALVAAGEPGHSAQDVVAVTGQGTTIPGKFAYGLISKDLEDETVEVWLDDCSGAYVSLGQDLTDSDGRIALDVAPQDLPGPGSYALLLRVLGDNTWTRSALWVLPPGSKMMVLDIDGTLTTDDMELFLDVMDELFDPILAGDYVPEARAGAQELTTIRAIDQGYILAYLTGRPYLLTDISRQWLNELAFAPGPLHVVDDVAEVLPTNDAVGDYKAAYLRELSSLGLDVTTAYGNADTDIYAYDQAGIPPERTFIVGDHGGEGGTVDVGEDYLGHLPEAEREGPADQPFGW